MVTPFFVLVAIVVLPVPMVYGQIPVFNVVRQSVSLQNSEGQGVAVDAASGEICVAGYFSDTMTFDTLKLDGTGKTDEIFIARFNASGALIWLQEAGGGQGVDRGFDVAMDADGNCLVTGGFSGTATFGTQQIVAGNTTYDMFLAKFAPNGTVLWVRNGGFTGPGQGIGVTSNAGGNIFVTGNFSGQAFPGSDYPLSGSVDGVDVFIASYDRNGVLRWAKGIQGSGNAYDNEGRSVASDTDGNVIVTGSFYGLIDIDNWWSSQEANAQDIFVAKFRNTDGRLLWAFQEGGAGTDKGIGVAVAADNTVWLTGEFTGAVTFSGSAITGGTELVGAGGTDFFVNAYQGGSGTLLHASRGGGAGDDAGFGISVLSSGTTLVTGSFSGAADIGGISLQTAGGRDMFIAAYDGSGTPLYGLKAGGPGDDAGHRLAVFLDNSFVVTGSFQAKASFGHQNLSTPADYQDTFVAVLGPPPISLAGDYTGNGTVGLDDVISILQAISQRR